MIRKLCFSAMLTVLASSYAVGEDWSGTPTVWDGNVNRFALLNPAYTGSTPPVLTPSLTGTDYLIVHSMDPACSGVEIVQNHWACNSASASVSLSLFAKAASVSSLTNSVSQLSGQFEGLSSELQGMASAEALEALQNDLAGMNSALTALAQRVARIEQVPSVKSYLRKQARDLAKQTVLIEALQPIAPPEGTTNRLGFSSAVQEGQSAFGLNYSHSSHDVDLSFGVAVSEDQMMARAGAGISW
jgi:hypothetical protein